MTMEVMEAILSRRSIRRFTTDPIPEELELKLVEAVIWAPSAGNLQSRKFYFIKDNKLKYELSRAAMRMVFIANVPLVVVGCVDFHAISPYGARGRQVYGYQDVAAGVENLLLAAHSSGLGAVWVGAFDVLMVRTLLNLPDYLEPVTIVPIGFHSENPPLPRRRPMPEIIEYR
jgi:nitroreductase